MAGRGANSPGIRQLLEAEKKAQERVQMARNMKQMRLKAAREEAEREIAQIRTDLENKFQESQRSHDSSKDNADAEIKKRTDEKLAMIERQVKENRNAVIKTVLDIVCKVTPEVHVNFKPKISA